MPWIEMDDHTADIGVEAWEDSLDKLFIENAIAFANLTSPDFDNVGSTLTHSVVIEAYSQSMVLHEFLNEILYLFDTKNFLPNGYKNASVIRTPDSIVFSVTLVGGTFVPEIHEVGAHIKAITWHMLTCEELDDGTFYSMVIMDV